MSTTLTHPLSFDDTAIAFAPKSDFELRKMQMLFGAMNNDFLVKTGTGLVQAALQWRLPVRFLIKKTLFQQFCGGESIEDCQPVIQRLGHYHIGTILDYSVEGKKTEKGFDATTQEILRTIAKAAKNPQNIPFCVFKITGIANTDTLAKLHAQQSLTTAETAAWEKVQQRVELICQTAHQAKVRIFVDAEESWLQNPIDALVQQMMEKYNREQAIVYNTYQMYLHGTLAKLKTAILAAQQQGYFLGAKVVRGAYMEKERERAAEMGYLDPVQPDKSATDQDFDQALQHCLQHINHVAICAGTHNEASTYQLVKWMEEKEIAAQHPHLFFAQLYGMSDHISYNLAKAGYNVAKYVPYGPVEAVMPYLFRRAAENTAVAGQSSRELSLINREIARRKKRT